MAFLELEAELSLILAKEELDEGLLADDEELSLLLLVVQRRQVGQHEVSEGSDLLRWRQSLHDLHEHLVDLLKQLVLLQIEDLAAASLHRCLGGLLSLQLLKCFLHFLYHFLNLRLRRLVALQLTLIL